MSYQELLDVNLVTTGAILAKKKLLIESGGFDVLMPRYQDWEFALRIAQRTDIYFLNTPLLTLCYQENSISHSTSFSKKYYAIERLINKNEDGLKMNPRAFSHHCWSMGLYCTFSDYIRWDMLKIGYKYAGFNYRRFLIYVFLRIGGVNIFKHFYIRNH